MHFMSCRKLWQRIRSILAQWCYCAVAYPKKAFKQLCESLQYASEGLDTRTGQYIKILQTRCRRLLLTSLIACGLLPVSLSVSRFFCNCLTLLCCHITPDGHGHALHNFMAAIQFLAKKKKRLCSVVSSAPVMLLLSSGKSR